MKVSKSSSIGDVIKEDYGYTNASSYGEPYNKWKNPPRYAGPYTEDDDDEFRAEEIRARVRHGSRCKNLVGRVITQQGWEGALILSYDAIGNDDEILEGVFKVRLRSGDIIDATWMDKMGTMDPAGISSEGWTLL